MKPNLTPWERLVDAARQAPAPDERDTAAPYGFATRVAALGLAAKPAASSIFEQVSLRSSLRALGVACALAVIAAGTSYHTIVELFADDAPSAETISYSAPAATAVAADATSIAAPAVDVPAAASAPATAPAATGDDPVAELLDIVS
jgi:hypothetical protein